VVCEFFFHRWEPDIYRLYSGLYDRGVKVESAGPGTPQIDKRWTWISMIDKLAGGDITKFNDIYDLTYIECLNLLSYYNERDRYYNSLNKQQQLKNKNSRR